MAAGMLADPGTEYGPCSESCTHRDCAASRNQSATACRICGGPIGYRRLFFAEGQHLVHERCLMEEVEA